MNPQAMAAGGWRIGDRVDAIRLFRTGDLDEQGNADPSKGEQLQVTIVGVAQRPDELIDDTEVRAPQVYLFPAFGRAHPQIGYYMIDYVRLAHGAADEAAFQQDAAALWASSDPNPLQISSMGDALVHADQSRRPLVVAVWLLAAVLFAAALIISALSIGRSLADHYKDSPVLRALGLSRTGHRTGHHDARHDHLGRGCRRCDRVGGDDHLRNTVRRVGPARARSGPPCRRQVAVDRCRDHRRRVVAAPPHVGCASGRTPTGPQQRTDDAAPSAPVGRDRRTRAGRPVDGHRSTGSRSNRRRARHGDRHGWWRRARRSGSPCSPARSGSQRAWTTCSTVRRRTGGTGISPPSTRSGRFPTMRCNRCSTRRASTNRQRSPRDQSPSRAHRFPLSGSTRKQAPCTSR